MPPIAGTLPELKPIDVSTWFGVFLPARTSRPVVDACNEEIKVWLRAEATRERFRTMAGFPAYGTPEAFETFVASQTAKGFPDFPRFPTPMGSLRCRWHKAFRRFFPLSHHPSLYLWKRSGNKAFTGQWQAENS